MNYVMQPIDEKALKTFFPDEEFVPKSQKTRVKILRGAVKTFAENGLEKATFTQIAKDAGVSRPLVVHYYKTLDEIFLKCSKYVLYSLFKELQEVSPKVITAEEKLKIFVTSYIRGIEKHPLEAKMYLRFHFQSALDEECRRTNTEAYKNSILQVQRLLDYGVSTGEFHCRDSYRASEAIMFYVLGRVSTMVSTNLYPVSEVESDLIVVALRIAQGEIQ